MAGRGGTCTGIIGCQTHRNIVVVVVVVCVGYAISNRMVSN